MGRVIHFEIHAENPDRAVTFYTNVFGWEFSKWLGPEAYWLVKTGPKEEAGIDGGLMKRRGTIDGTAVVAYVCTVQTNSIDDTVAKWQSHPSGGWPTAKIPKETSFWPVAVFLFTSFQPPSIASSRMLKKDICHRGTETLRRSRFDS